MQPLTAASLKGSWGTLLLPINDDDSIDFVRLSDAIDALIEARVSGIYSNGTAGEFYTQTEDEFERISLLLAERCEAAGMPFQIGASHMSAQTSLERARRAAQLKPGALQVILPDWLPVTIDEAVAFLARVAEAAAPCSLVLYNPPHAKQKLTPQEFGQLKARVPALIGVKVAGGGADWFAQMRETMGGLSVFIPGSTLASGILSGAHGAYSNVACLQPAGAQRWYEQIATNAEAALELETRIQSFLRTHVSPLVRDQKYVGGAADKLLAAIGGWADIGVHMRWPYRSIPAEVAQQLRPIAHTHLPELFQAP
jgi:dihydrodipicolinate synthase/N-acetylneuraminate lyase